MHSIHSRIRSSMLVAAALLLVACGDGSTAPDATDPLTPPAPVPPPSSVTPVVGRWAATQIDGKPMPAVIASGTHPEGWTWEIRVLWDSLEVTADGRWRQRVRGVETNSKGEAYPLGWNDRGLLSRDGQALSFESDWIEHVSFSGRLTTSGDLELDHDFTLDDDMPVMKRVLKK